MYVVPLMNKTLTAVFKMDITGNFFAAAVEELKKNQQE